MSLHVFADTEHNIWINLSPLVCSIKTTTISFSIFKLHPSLQSLEFYYKPTHNAVFFNCLRLYSAGFLNTDTFFNDVRIRTQARIIFFFSSLSCKNIQKRVDQMESFVHDSQNTNESRKYSEALHWRNYLPIDLQGKIQIWLLSRRGVSRKSETRSQSQY